MVIPINLVVEDDLSETVVRQILRQSGWPYQVEKVHGKSGFGYIRKRIGAFHAASRVMPYFVLTDLDQTECPPSLIQDWLPEKALGRNLIFRVAVREVESWVMAHREAFAKFLGVRSDLIPDNPDALEDPKRTLIGVVAKSRNREIRDSIVPPAWSTRKVGPNYNFVLGYFVQSRWEVKIAQKYSLSLKKAFKAVCDFKPQIFRDRKR